MRPNISHVAAATAALTIATAANADSVVINFEGFGAGTVITNQYAPDISISAVNFTGPDVAMIFDTENPTGGDNDLGGPNWAGGNIPTDTVLGNILIISEDGDASDPDDEGSRPAGTLFFQLGRDAEALSFDAVDLERASVLPNPNVANSGTSIDFFLDGQLEATIAFSEFLAGGTFDRGVVLGDNTANSISNLTAESLGLKFFDAFRINVGGSAGFDNFVVDFGRAIPVPSASLLAGVGLLAVSTRRRR